MSVAPGHDRTPRDDAINRRTLLGKAGGAAAATLLAGYGGNVGLRRGSAQEKTVRWAQLYTVESGIAARANQEWLRKVAQQFERENSGWKVKLEGFKWDQIDERAILDLRAGVEHDLFFTSPQLMAKHFAADSLLDLRPYLREWSSRESRDLSWSPVWKSGSIAGRQLGIPTGVHTRTVAYNRDLFEQAGLDSNARFTTPAQMLNAAKELTSGDTWGLVVYLGPSRATIELAYAPLVWHFGGDFYNRARKSATLTTSASLRAAKFLFDLAHTHKVTPPFAYAPDADYNTIVLNNFVDGKAGQSMGFGSYWIAALNDEKMIRNCFPAARSCRPVTAGVMVQPSRAHAQFTNGWLLSIHKLSKEADAAFKLLEVAVRPQNLLTFPDAGLPARLSAWSAPRFSSPFYRTWFQAAKQGRPMPPTPYYAELADTVAAALSRILVRKADIADTLAKAERDWNKKYAGK
jgi:ABC-type glycerol-3-phosphate transport system substrate-binding protein